MFSSFFKYQSIGNDVIILDGADYKPSEIDLFLSSSDWPIQVKGLCTRSTGVGADCVLVITNKESTGAKIRVFNADGSEAENCLNGVRCIAHYLFSTNSFQKKLIISIGSREFLCLEKGSPQDGKLSIETVVSCASVKGEIEVSVDGKIFKGWSVDVGNPHFVVLGRQNSHWLGENGSKFQQLKQFPQGVNIEFLWEPSAGFFNLLAYERGCGLTNGCSSGITAAAAVLRENEMLCEDETISIAMPGGEVEIWFDQANAIHLNALSHFVFRGSL